MKIPGEKYPRYKKAKDGGDIVEILDVDDGEVIGTAVDLEYAMLWTSADDLLAVAKKIKAWSDGKNKWDSELEAAIKKVEGV